MIGPVRQLHVDLVHLAVQTHVGRAFADDIGLQHAGGAQLSASLPSPGPAAWRRSPIGVGWCIQRHRKTADLLEATTARRGSRGPRRRPMPVGSAPPARRGRVRRRQRGPGRRHRSRPWHSAAGPCPSRRYEHAPQPAMFSVTMRWMPQAAADRIEAQLGTDLSQCAAPPLPHRAPCGRRGRSRDRDSPAAGSHR